MRTSRRGWINTTSISFVLTLAAAAAGDVAAQTPPRIKTDGIVNAAGAPLPPAPVSPGSIITIYGSNFNSSAGDHAGGASATPPLPNKIGDTQVLINSRFAPLYYVDSTQINAAVPWEVAGASYLTIQVIVNGAPSNLATVGLATRAPGILAITHNADGHLVSAAQPAVAGEYLTIYVVGLGPVANPPATGAAALSKPLSNTLQNPTLTIGGVAANVLFSGLTPGFSGLYQVNAQVPTGVPNGDITVVLGTVDAVSNTTTIAVQSGKPSGVGVSVSPVSAGMATGATQQFTATVNGGDDSTVIWSVNGVAGGSASVGTISAGGLYTAPASVPGGGLTFISAVSAADASVAGTATALVRLAPQQVSPLGRYRTKAPGVYARFERRGWPSQFSGGEVIQNFYDFDPILGTTVSEEIALQLDKMKAMGITTITYFLWSANDPDWRDPFVLPLCPIPSVLGLNWPQPTGVELSNLKAFFDLVQSKGMHIRLGLQNNHMEEQPATNAQVWLGAILGAIGKHPALDVVTFDGTTFTVDVGNGPMCATPAEAPLWLGPKSDVGQYVEWAVRYALSLGVPPQKVSAEEIIGDYFLDSEPGNQFATDNHLWNPVKAMKKVFDAVEIPENQRTYSLSWYEHYKCLTARYLACTDTHPHTWAEWAIQSTYATIGTENGAKVVVAEMSDMTPINPTWKTEWAMESLVSLVEKYPMEGASYWQWTNTDNIHDADPINFADPVKRRGVAFVYNPVQKEVLDWGGFHLTSIPNGSFEDDLDAKGIPVHWTITGKGAASAYYLPQESGQPQVPSRGAYSLRLTASDNGGAISATSERIGVTPNTAYTTAANLRFAWTGDANPSGSAATRPQVFATVHYLNASGQAASTPATVFPYFQENSTPGFQTFVFQYTTPSDARAVQIELGAARNGLAAPIVVDFDNLR